MTGKAGGQSGKGVAVTFKDLTYTVPVKKDKWAMGVRLIWSWYEMYCIKVDAG